MSETNRSSLPVAGIISEPGSSVKYKTGDWRTYEPVIDHDKCVKCLICWIYCPDMSIEQIDDGGVKVNYDYCKGCGICAQECPVQCISMEEG